MSALSLRMEPKIARRRRAVRSQAARSHRTAALAAIATAAALTGTWWAFTGPAVAIRHVAINGYGRDDANVLAAYVQRAAGRATMLSLPTDEIRRELGRFAWVSDVHVQRDWPASIVVTITQVRPAAVAIPAQGRLGLLSPSGRLLAGVPASGIPQNLPQIGVASLPKLLGDALPDPDERNSIATLAALRGVGGVHVRRLQVRDGGVTAVLDSGMSLRLGSPDELEAKMTAIRTVLPKIPLNERVAGRYLDVRFPRFAAVGKAQAARPAAPASGSAAPAADTVVRAGTAVTPSVTSAGSGTAPAAAAATTPSTGTTPSVRTPVTPATTTPPTASSATVPPPPPPLPTSASASATPVPSTTTSAPVPATTTTIDPGLRVSP